MQAIDYEARYQERAASGKPSNLWVSDRDFVHRLACRVEGAAHRLPENVIANVHRALQAGTPCRQIADENAISLGAVYYQRKKLPKDDLPAEENERRFAIPAAHWATQPMRARR